MQSVILAGGLGTRLRPYTIFTPKPMLPLGEKPLLEHLLDWNKKHRIRSAVLCVSYLRRAIEDYFGDGSNFGMEISYAASPRPLATAGQLRTARDWLRGDFVCMYGDSLFGFDLGAMMRQHQKRRPLITMNLHDYSTRLPYGVIRTSGKKVSGWDEKPLIKARINTGCYAMSPRVFDYVPSGRPYGMDAVVRRALKSGERIDAFVTGGDFVDIGDKESYLRAHREYSERLGPI